MVGNLCALLFTSGGILHLASDLIISNDAGLVFVLSRHLIKMCFIIKLKETNDCFR